MNLFSEACRQSQTAPGRQVDPVWLNAIRKVEAGGERDPDNAVGDHGLAVGAFQIHPNYYIDATGQDPTKLKADPRRDFQKSVQAVRNYIKRYGKKLTDDERAMLHHYGPNWRYASRYARAQEGARQGGVIGKSVGEDPYVRKYREHRKGYDTLVNNYLNSLDNPLQIPARQPQPQVAPVPAPVPQRQGNVQMSVTGSPVSMQGAMNADGTVSPVIDNTRYTVKSGDSLWKMWKGRKDNESWAKFRMRLQGLNPDTDFDNLKPGQEIRTR